MGQHTAIWWRLRIAALFLLLLLGAATTASAQLPEEAEDPCGAINQTSPGTCDSEFTPHARDGAQLGWQRIAGAAFGKQDAAGSSTPITADFFGADFRTTTEGFFTGAACRDPETPFEELDGCERVPVIYRYEVPPGQKAEIEQVFGPEHSPGEDERGFVSAVAWIGNGRALAVGGTGHYPRRELPWCRKQEGEDPAAEALRCKDATAEDYAARDLAGTESNAAGRARAWLYAEGRWRELSGEELPQTATGEPMAALTTLDCTPRPSSDGELCWAGGMRQLWRFQDGQFTASFTPTSVDDEGNPTVVDGQRWRFRVRSLRFNPNEVIPEWRFQAFAVTSGCCAENELANSPRLLAFDGQRWHSLLLTADRLVTQGPTPVAASGVDSGVRVDPDSDSEPLRSRQGLPDSYYSLWLTGTGGGAGESGTVLATPGAPAPADGQPGASEPVSQLVVTGMPDVDGGSVAFGNTNSSNVFNTGELNLSDVRLHAVEGDFAGAHGTADWAAGELRSSGEGIAYTTLRRGTTSPFPLTCQETLFTDLSRADPDTDCRPREAAEIQEDTRSHSLYSLGTYSLNALAATPEGDLFFAAGDRGGIARLGGEGGAAGEAEEPPPDRVGTRQRADLPDGGLYPGGSAGVVGGSVPSQGEQPLVELPEPRLVPVGAPDPTRSDSAPTQDVASIVMSRDGSEGWAIGPGASKTAPGTLFHYDGSRWSRCEMDGVPGLVKPDPACVALAGLQRNVDSGGASKPMQLIDADRVPLERDSDPSNDDEFELVAIASDFKPGPTERILRYRDGRWSIDTAATARIAELRRVGSWPQYIRDVAFTAPDDGWILFYDGTREIKLVHFDGTTWASCQQNRAACDDAAHLIPDDLSDVVGKSTTSDLFLATAGRRLYYAGTRVKPGGSENYPFIVHKDPGQPWERDLDHGCESRNPGNGACVGSGAAADQGDLGAISVTQDDQGRYSGWAAGLFGKGGTGVAGTPLSSGQAPLLRLDPGGTSWRTHLEHDAATDYLLDQNDIYDNIADPGVEPPRLLSLTGLDGGEEAVLAPARRPGGDSVNSIHPMLSWGEGGRWRVAAAPFMVSESASSYRRRAAAASPRAIAPDGQGGYWVAARRAYDLQSPTQRAIFFYRYSDRAPRQVFSDAPHPIREPIAAISPAPDGRIWAATKSGTVYRYDRALGWDRAVVPGWERGRVITRASPARAIAIGETGEGVLVGEGGRIAHIDPGGVRLDQAAGASLTCQAAAELPVGAPDVPVCGTGHDLFAVAVAPDGSAMVGGEERGLLWRPAGGNFQAIAKPPASLGASFTGISMPAPGRAFVVTDGGQVFAGEGSGDGSWSWELENLDEGDEVVTRSSSGKGIPLRAIALDSGEHGYAVGDRGVLIERTGDPEQPWRRLDAGVLEDLTSVALPYGGGEGALIGGELGLILTLRDGRFEVARTDDFTEPLTNAHRIEDMGSVVGLALLPGVAPGQAEAWAASQANPDNSRRPGASALLHYTNAPDEPLLRPDGRAASLPDAPPRRPEELELAALGRSDCHLETPGGDCIEAQGTNFFSEVLQRRAVDEIAERVRGHERSVALFTGDIDFGRSAELGTGPRLTHSRWVELTADRFAREDVPLFGAMGVIDLSEAENCENLGGHCVGTRRFGGIGSSLPWRAAMAGMPAPWGSAEPAVKGEVAFVPVEDGELTKATNQEPEVRDPTGTLEDSALALPGRGARTHYAIDITDTQGSETPGDDEVLARLVVVDSSHRSLSASDPNQNPVEQQLAWLQQVLCKPGSAADTTQRPCTRAPSSRAIVLSNTPTFSYGPGALSDTDTAEGTQFEQILFSEDVDAVISGRLGWNALYHALSPGLHTPDAGGEHPDPGAPPEPLPGQPEPIPFLVAAGAGGTFGPPYGQTQGSASAGFWHGYSVLRLDPESGNVFVEQRPVFDWLGIRPDPDTRATHAVRPGKKLSLEGFGREAASMDEPLRYDEIGSYAITHRYDLLVADTDKPWLPAEASGASAAELASADPARTDCASYLCLSASTGTIDRTTGVAKAGKGNYPRTFAIAALSVGELSAIYPLVFEPRASFRPPSPPPARPAALPPPPAPPTQPPQPPPPTVEALVPPVLPNLTAAQPPAPPVPPTPPPAESQAPLDLNLAPTALEVNPPTAVSQPPTPPVNPAPPSGARREARQRQAAAQKSGAEAGEEGSEELGDAHGRIDSSDDPNAAMTRHEATALDRSRPGPSFTPAAGPDQPSAWARDLLLGGGLGIAALVLALGLGTARPTPRRRRQPETPAPAYSRGEAGARRR